MTEELPDQAGGETEGEHLPDPLNWAAERKRVHVRDRGYRRAFRVGLAVSLLVHLALILIVSRALEVPSPDVEMPSVRPLPPPEMVVVRVRVREDQPATQTERPQREEQPARAEPEPVEEEPAPTEETEPTRRTNAERLRPRQGDPRVWKPPLDPKDRELLRGFARADSAVRALLRQYLGSLNLSEEQYRRARAWTFGEGDKRWGISPEGLHLGDITIPIPLGQLLSPTGPMRRELEQELKDLEAIRRQEAIGRARETREERIEEMRERSRQEADSSSSPDTTSSSRDGVAPLQDAPLN